MAVVSNKYQEGVEILVNSLLAPYIDIALGSSDKVAVKPSPDMVNIVLDHFNVKNDECLFVGDSDVDIITGKSNNMKTVAVSWGYKDLDVITQQNPDYIIDEANQLLLIIKEISKND